MARGVGVGAGHAQGSRPEGQPLATAHSPEGRGAEP